MEPRRRAAKVFAWATIAWRYLLGCILVSVLYPVVAQTPFQSLTLACGGKAWPPPSDPLTRTGFVLRMSGAYHVDYSRGPAGAYAQMPMVRAMKPFSAAQSEIDADPISLNATGMNHTYEGRYAAAAQSFERALSLSNQGRDRQVEAASISNLGLLAAAQGRYDEARARFESALSAYTALAKPNALSPQAVPGAAAGSSPAELMSDVMRRSIMDVRAGCDPKTDCRQGTPPAEGRQLPELAPLLNANGCGPQSNRPIDDSGLSNDCKVLKTVRS